MCLLTLGWPIHIDLSSSIAYYRAIQLIFLVIAHIFGNKAGSLGSWCWLLILWQMASTRACTQGKAWPLDRWGPAWQGTAGKLKIKLSQKCWCTELGICLCEKHDCCQDNLFYQEPKLGQGKRFTGGKSVYLTHSAKHITVFKVIHALTDSNFSCITSCLPNSFS